MVIWSPLCSRISLVGVPLTSVPLLDPRSSSRSCWSRTLSLQWIRLDQVSRIQISASSPRPIVTGSSVRTASEAEGTVSIQVKRTDIARARAGMRGGITWSFPCVASPKVAWLQSSGARPLVRRKSVGGETSDCAEQAAEQGSSYPDESIRSILTEERFRRHY